MNEINDGEGLMDRFETFQIASAKTDKGAMLLSGFTNDGKAREFQLVVHRDKVTNVLELSVVPHIFSDTRGRVFPDSGPWTLSELPPTD